MVRPTSAAWKALWRQLAGCCSASSGHSPQNCFSVSPCGGWSALLMGKPLGLGAVVFHCTVRDIFSAACGLGVRTEVMKCTHEETRNYPLERPAPSTDEFIQRRQIITCKISSAWRFLSRSSAVRFVGAETHITPGHAGSKSICFLCCCCGQSAVGVQSAQVRFAHRPSTRTQSK